ncbi:MAG TPA: hypothetical protein VMW16_03620 [Sedimentisphaerales bacterium]|nr:hypothetical protein [Sedimentisphaerales bacterium]
MANETIYGCVDWATGKIKFAQDACYYYGCIIWEGVHAGQVAVTIDMPNCDDTYYGCVNWATGKFQVVVPDNCCEYPPCEYCVDTPSQVTITFTGLTECECLVEMYGSAKFVGTAAAINGNSYVLPARPDLPCLWKKKFTGNFGTWKCYYFTECQTFDDEVPLTFLDIGVRRCVGEEGDGLHIVARVGTGFDFCWGPSVGQVVYFYSTSEGGCLEAEITGCVGAVDLPNQTGCDIPVIGGYLISGTATIVEGG